MSSFESLGLHPDLIRAVRALNYESPTPIQTAAIPLSLDGRDVMGCAQTGGGKTAAFALPILHHLLKEPSRSGVRALILVPTRELAAQVEEAFGALGKFTSFKRVVIIGGVGFHPQVDALRRGAQIVVATPGRLMDHLKQGTVRLDRVEQLVLDEADRMLDMGFLPDMKSVISHLPRERQTQLFSATLLQEVERVAAFALRDPKRVEITRPTTVAEGISQIVYPVVQSQKVSLLVQLLRDTEMKSVLVFSRTKHGADKVAKRLAAEGFQAGVLHGNRSQNQRTQAMEAFRHGRSRLLVATDIAARGIDVKGVSHVVNFDVPRHTEDYVHRVGRTARAYGVGDAVTFVDPSEEGYLRDVERFVGIKFPRAVLPDFQYNNAPRDAQDGGRDRDRRPAPRRDDRRSAPRGPRDGNSRREEPRRGESSRVGYRFRSQGSGPSNDRSRPAPRGDDRGRSFGRSDAPREGNRQNFNRGDAPRDGNRRDFGRNDAPRDGNRRDGAPQRGGGFQPGRGPARDERPRNGRPREERPRSEAPSNAPRRPEDARRDRDPNPPRQWIRPPSKGYF